MDADAISRRLREARRESGLTQQQLADLLEVHVRTIENYERGQINYRVVGSLAAAVGRRVEWLLHGDQAGEPVPATLEPISELRAEVAEIREAVQRVLQLLLQQR